MSGEALARVAVFGGVYSNHLALRAAIADATRRGCQKLLCLGDMGAFGPNPDKVFPLLIEAGVVSMQGNYDDSISQGLNDCQCGYTDPADNYYARLSYRYTYAKTSPRWRAWLAGLPKQLWLVLQGPKPRQVLCCHGSPRRTNEFLWESTTPTHLLERFCEQYHANIIVGTHTGLPWGRRLSGGRLFVNCGVLGRPANDGTPRVGYTILDVELPEVARYIALDYDHEALASEMAEEELPEPFIGTIRSGWWRTCLEVLPAKERARGRY